VNSGTGSLGGNVSLYVTDQLKSRLLFDVLSYFGSSPAYAVNLAY